ncbi:MAG: MoxR family ATPase, partial [Pseudomonadota bacterium]
EDKALENIILTVVLGGHALIEGPPGTAKTLMVRTLSFAIDSLFRRIQFTPDLMPSDIIGTNIYDMKKNEFVFRRGPIFTDILLADEINRAPAKTQAALLESMEERTATVDGVKYDISPIFSVFATQNPIEFEGTYPLPEAQLDRFLLKIVLGFPEPQQELEILDLHDKGFNPAELEKSGATKIMGKDDILHLRRFLQTPSVDKRIHGYIVDLVQNTRKHPNISVGSSPRGAIGLLKMAKASACIEKRDYVIPDDVKKNAPSVLRHRVLLRPEAQIEGLTAEDVISEILQETTVPM